MYRTMSIGSYDVHEDLIEYIVLLRPTLLGGLRLRGYILIHQLICTVYIIISTLNQNSIN